MTSSVVGGYTFTYNNDDPLKILITGGDSFTGERTIDVRSISEFRYSGGKAGEFDLDVISDLSNAKEEKPYINSLGTNKAIIDYIQKCIDTMESPGELRNKIPGVDPFEDSKEVVDKDEH